MNFRGKAGLDVSNTSFISPHTLSTQHRFIPKLNSNTRRLFKEKQTLGHFPGHLISSGGHSRRDPAPVGRSESRTGSVFSYSQERSMLSKLAG